MKTPADGAHYRPEVDGLRAIAVIAVVLYHARVPGLSGGFAGVDVFFAISGYVVMSALQREAAQSGHISWARFLVCRIRRLLPMLLITIAVSLLLAYWLLPPFGEFQQLCKSAMAAAGLSANLYLWRFAGSYFSTGVEQMPLMHLWSLSVEEQFYLLTPLVFLLARWQRLGGLSRIILALTAISLAITVWGTLKHPAATFYLPLTRAWEFGLGALAALITLRRDLPRWCGAVLLAALGGSLLWLDEHAAWLPLHTGLPALLTALCLLQSATPQHSPAGTRYLRNPWLCWIGKRSYAWYLLHWPLLVFYRKYFLEDVSSIELFMVSLAALLAAAAAHRWIETPARFADWPSLRSNARLISLSAAATALVMTAAFAMGIQASARQMEPRWQSTVAFDHWKTEAFQCMRRQDQDEKTAIACTAPGSSPQAQTLVLWGDSHAYHLRTLLLKLADEEQLALDTWSMGGCPPLSKSGNGLDASEASRLACLRFETRALTDILHKQASRKTIVVLAARWQPYQAVEPISVIEKPGWHRLIKGRDLEATRNDFALALRETVLELLTKQVEVILVAPVPEQRVPPPLCKERFDNSKRCFTTRAEVEAHRKTTMQLLRSITQRHPAVQLIDPLDTFCDAAYCHIGPADALWYVDDDHLSNRGAEKLLPVFRSAIAEAQRRIASAPGS